MDPHTIAQRLKDSIKKIQIRLPQTANLTTREIKQNLVEFIVTKPKSTVFSAYDFLRDFDVDSLTDDEAAWILMQIF